MADRQAFRRMFLPIVSMSGWIFLCMAALPADARARPTERPPQTPARINPDQPAPGTSGDGISRYNEEAEEGEYQREREEHIALLRGYTPGKPFDFTARLRAIEHMRSQEVDRERRVRALGSVGIAAVPAWVELGPNPIPNGQTSPANAVSGRVTAIEVDPTDANRVYVGTAQGGVYRSADGGANWTPIFDGAQSLAIGALALDSANGRLYVGTGEANLSIDSFGGVGVYRIDNVNTTATLVGPINPVRNYNDASGTARSAAVFTGRSIGRILIVPNDPTTLFVATTRGLMGIGAEVPYGNATPPLGITGLYRLTNVAGAAGSAVATKLRVSSTGTCSDTPCTGSRGIDDMVFDPADASGNTLVLWQNGATASGDGGVWRSVNAMAATPTFTQILATTVAGARGEFAVYRQGTNAAVMYVATGESSSGTSCSDLEQSGALRVSTNGGTSFGAKLAGGGGFCGGQCWYDIAIAAGPGATTARTDDVLYLGGNVPSANNCQLQAGRSTNGGASFTEANGTHADTHVIRIAPSNASIVYRGDDGGIWRSTDAGVTWVSRNNATFRATQFQSLAVHPTDPNFSIGGTQDNGTNHLRANQTWNRIDWGDGGFAAIDQNATDTTNVQMYHTYYNQTSSLIGFARVSSATAAFDGNWQFSGCDGGVPANGIGCSDTVLFYAPLVLGPGNPNTVYYGTDRLYRSTDRGVTHTVVSQAPLSANVAISSIGISPQDDLYRIVGLRNGALFYTRTGSSTLTVLDAIGSGTVPDAYVARVVFDPANKNTAYIALGGYRGGVGASNSHVWRVSNLNATPAFTAINGSGATGLPDIPVNAFAVDPAQTTRLFAGTDIGVYISEDGGSTWAPFGTGLPRIAVFDMAVQNVKRVLRIATHGRGLWEATIPADGSAATCGTLATSVAESATDADAEPGPVAGLPAGGVWNRTVRDGGETWTYTFTIADDAPAARVANVDVTGGSARPRTATAAVATVPGAASGILAEEPFHGKPLRPLFGDAAIPPVDGAVHQYDVRMNVDASFDGWTRAEMLPSAVESLRRQGTQYRRVQDQVIPGTSAAGGTGHGSPSAVTHAARLFSPVALQYRNAFEVPLDGAMPADAAAFVHLYVKVRHPHLDQLRISLRAGESTIVLWDRWGGTDDGGYDDDAETDSTVVVDRILSDQLAGRSLGTSWTLEIENADPVRGGTLEQARVIVAAAPRSASPVTVHTVTDIAALRAYLRTAAAGGGSEVTQPTIGQVVYFYGDYTLSGSGSNSTITQRALLDGTVYCSGSASQAPGLTYWVHCNGGWTATSGTHTLRWDFDYANSLAETNESNNSATKSIVPTATMDIAAQRAYMRTATGGGGSEVDPPSVGQAVYLYADYSITGSGNAVTVTQRAMLDGTLFCNGSASQSPGLSYYVHCSGPWTATAGSHTLRWDLDYANSVPESNESNNSATKSFSSGGLDIAAQRAYLKTALTGGTEVSQPAVGQTVYFFADYQVTGSGSAVTISHRALLDGATHCSFNASGSPGSSYTASCNAGWTATAGTHTLRWDLDYTNTVAETNESNNSASQSISPTSSVDIAAQRAYLRTASAGGGVEVSQPSLGQTVYFYVDYQITGTGSAINVSQRALLDGSVHCSGVNAQAPGSTYTSYCIVGWAATAGTHTLQWDLDYGNTVAESNESNNSTSKTITPSTSVDIIAQRAYLRTGASGSGTEIDTPSVGQTVYFHTAFQVTGSGSAVSVSQRAVLDGNTFCSCQSTATPGNSFVSSCTQGWTATAGTHTLRWDLDHTNSVTETNETNNSASKTFTPGAAPAVTTGNASSTTQSGATLGGTVNPNGVSTSTFFDYGLTSAYGNAVSAQTLTGTSSQAISATISGLACGTLYHYRARATNANGTNSGSDATFTTAACPAGAGSALYVLTPCRILDTRGATGPYGGPALAANGTRDVTLPGRCAVPADTKAVVVNVAVVLPAASGYLTLYPAGIALPAVSSVNYRDGRTRTNNGVVRLSDTGLLSVYNSGPATVHFVIDITGYFR